MMVRGVFFYDSNVVYDRDSKNESRFELRMSRSKQELAKASKLQKSTETIIGGVWFSHYERSRLEFNVPSEMFAKGK